MINKRILVHLENLVALCPASDDQEMVQKALRYCASILRSTGSFKEINFYNFNSINSLTAYTRVPNKSKVLLQAHIDVVASSESLVYEVRDGWAYGRGVFDMLFAPACYLAFIEENMNVLHQLDMGIMLTGDEEIGGENGVNALLLNDHTAEVCILPDAGYGFGDLNVSAKGVYQFDLIANGKAHHGSRPWEGDGACNKLVLMLSELMTSFDHSDKDNSTITIARLNAGDADNKGPSTAKARIDIRYKDKVELQLIQSEVERIITKFNSTLDNIHIADDYTLDLDNQNIQNFIALYEKHLGKKVSIIKSPGSSDARHFDAHSIPVIELRPDGFGAHSDDERINIDSLRRFYDLLSEYILETARI